MSFSSHSCIELIKDELFITFQRDVSEKKFATNVVYYVNDKSFVYTSFFADFGPLDLGITHKFCDQMKRTVEMAKRAKKPVLYVCSDHPHHRSNSAVLILAYLIFELQLPVETAYAPFIGISPPFFPFRDAGFCINTYPVTVLDCACAMHKAQSLEHYVHSSFSSSGFHSMAKLENGDISWIVPKKFIAFSGPLTNRRQLSADTATMLPHEYVPLMKKLGVTCIVRFNSKCYDRKVFISNGIKHVDMLYEDGGNPTEAILQAFLQLCETTKGAIAVHCKAGLGRTGTNIAAYMLKHFQYTTRESIAWCRMCRPGSIVGPQQQYLAANEVRLIKEGEGARRAAAYHSEQQQAQTPLSRSLPNPGTAMPTSSADRRDSQDYSNPCSRPSSSNGVRSASTGRPVSRDGGRTSSGQPATSSGGANFNLAPTTTAQQSATKGFQSLRIDTLTNKPTPQANNLQFTNPSTRPATSGGRIGSSSSSRHGHILNGSSGGGGSGSGSNNNNSKYSDIRNSMDNVTPSVNIPQASPSRPPSGVAIYSGSSKLRKRIGSALRAGEGHSKGSDSKENAAGGIAGNSAVRYSSIPKSMWN